jgi:hypothetical protein
MGKMVKGEEASTGRLFLLVEEREREGVVPFPHAGNGSPERLYRYAASGPLSRSLTGRLRSVFLKLAQA